MRARVWLVRRQVDQCTTWAMTRVNGAVTRLNNRRISLTDKGIRGSLPTSANPHFDGVSGDHEERRREHGQRDVPIPRFIATDPVVIETGLVLGGLEALLDRPPRARDPDQLVEVGAGRPETHVVG